MPILQLYEKPFLSCPDKFHMFGRLLWETLYLYPFTRLFNSSLFIKLTLASSPSRPRRPLYRQIKTQPRAGSGD